MLNHGFKNIILKKLKAYRSILTGVIIFSVHLLLMGCLNPNSDPASSTAATGFSGTDSAVNLNGTTIKITWLATTDSSATGYRVYELLTNGSLSFITQLSTAFTTYNHTSLTEGTSHSYVVKLAYTNGGFDSNLVSKTAYTYSGITSVTSTGATTATLNFTATGAASASASIYAKVSGITTKIGTATNAATSYNVSGLAPSTTYIYSVHAVDSSNADDSNTATATITTGP